MTTPHSPETDVTAPLVVHPVTKSVDYGNLSDSSRDMLQLYQSILEGMSKQDIVDYLVGEMQKTLAVRDKYLADR